MTNTKNHGSDTAQEREQIIKTFGAVEGLNQTLGRLGEYLAQPRAGR